MQRSATRTNVKQIRTMKNSFPELLDESIKLELNLAKLYTVFNDLFPDDEEFWWQLALEERSHSALLQQEKKQPHPSAFFPENLLADDLKSLAENNAGIEAMIVRFSANPPSRERALNEALRLELSAGEAHFQKFMESESDSLSADIFRQLASEDKDHAERIREYMQNNHIKAIPIP
jgi:hypothetical protein